MEINKIVLFFNVLKNFFMITQYLFIIFLKKTMNKYALYNNYYCFNEKYSYINILLCFYYVV